MPAATDVLVQFRGVQKTYDGVTLVVDTLDLEIRRGEFQILLGPSGSGKTTAPMMLAGFEAPTRGRILLDGRLLGNLPPHRRDIGLVFQNYALFPHMTVRENHFFLAYRSAAGAKGGNSNTRPDDLAADRRPGPMP